MLGALHWLGRRVRHPVRSWYQAVGRLPDGELRRRLMGFPGLGSLCQELRRATQEGGAWVFPLPSCPWGYLFQRPHQVARAAARAGRTVLYAVDHTSMLAPDVDVRGLRQVEPRLYLFNDGCGGRTLQALDGRMTVWQYWPHQASFVRRLPAKRRVVYDVIDDLSVFQQYPGIEEDHRSSLESADVVLATSQSLYEKTAERRRDVLLAPNAACYEDFARPREVRWPEVEGLRARSEVLVTYYGALADWVDFALVRACAERLPGWTFLMVGQAYPGVLERERPERTRGVAVLPRAPYGHLPWLLRQSDVAMIPFKVNEITRNTSPVKLFEYMAAGKPVVSTDLPECRRYAPVAVARDAEEFIAELRRARQRAGDPSFVAELQACAREQTWDARLKVVFKALEALDR